MEIHASGFTKAKDGTMPQITGEQLFAHVRALADDIGPRPTGRRAEAQAREYIRKQLAEMGIELADELPFETTGTWGWGLIPPLLLNLSGNALPPGNGRRALGALLAFLGAYDLWRGTTGMPGQLLERLAPKLESRTLVARIAPQAEIKRRVVLIGHTDTNKHRLSFSPITKRLMLPTMTTLIAATLLRGVALLVGLRRVQQWIDAYILFGLGVLAADELFGYIDGANDNATAVACLLEIGRQLQATPLQHTEVWLAFTGAEETGLHGTHALLDTYGNDLRDAWFVDFEMVGTGNIAYVTQHSGLTNLNPYQPDSESLALAREVAALHPELQVTGREMIMMEEVAALRKQGYRGICLVGMGEDGWLANWHQYSDNSRNIETQPLERAAHFAWYMLEQLDARE